MFCFGRITGEITVNTMNGEKEAFLGTDRMSGPYPVGGCRKHLGTSWIRKDAIDLEHDIFDRDTEGFETLTDEDLFLLMLNVPDGGMDKVKHLGFRNLMNAGVSANLAARLLKSRSGVEEQRVASEVKM